LYGWTSQEVINHPVRDILNTEFSTSLDAIRTQLQHKGIWQGEIKHTTRDGKKLILDSQWTIYKDDSGEEVAIVEVNNNITERRKFELELDRKEAMFHTMVDWTYNWEFWLSPDRKIIYMTPSVERITGYKPEEFSVTPQLLNLIVHEKDQALWEHLLQWDSAADRQSIKDVRFRILRKNGEQKWIQASCRPVSDDQGQYLGLRVSARDITEQVKAEEQIRTLAYFDSLTGLPNRRLLVDRLGQTLASSSRKKVFSALIFIDLDHFKEINDSQGHVIGDKLLVDVAGRIESCVRQMDTLSRQGGDEFVVVLEHLSDDEEHAAARAKEIAEDIRKSLDFSYSSIAGGAEHMNSCSIGITLFNSERENVDLLMKQADLAMYQAKTEGRNAIRFFNPIMQSTIDKRSELVSNIHKGIENNEFRLFFQPQVNCQEQLVAVEGLVRWVRPEAGIATPNEFISLCEQTGLILQLGEIVLEQGMQQLKEWERIEKFKNLNISLNVSPRQFLQPDFVKSITEKIQRIGCNPNLLTLEITENLVLKSVSDVALQMDQLRKLGISFSLDDFGTGYSSLDKLKKLPFSQLKIDKSFVRDLCVDNSDKAIINAMLAMGKSFGLEIVAEGVENSAQAKYFIDNNCDKLQGYLYSKALSIEDFIHEYL
jgi:diguanylate cyclase (GGDEF)-like protein/PAS domain S-box-containing protein